MQEIERKYLVLNDDFKDQAYKVYHIEQGYLSVSPTIRVRIQDKEAFLTIKGKSEDQGLIREEYEYSIPLHEAQELMKLTKGQTIIKDRYIVPFEGYEWEVDIFHGRHEGLILAEIELDTIDMRYPLPSWLGEEVTGKGQYYNASMALI